MFQFCPTIIRQCDNTEKRFLCQKQSPTSKGLWTTIHGAQYAYLESNTCIKSWNDAVTRCDELGGGAKVASVLSQEVKDEYLATFRNGFIPFASAKVRRSQGCKNP